MRHNNAKLPIIIVVRIDMLLLNALSRNISRQIRLPLAANEGAVTDNLVLVEGGGEAEKYSKLISLKRNLTLMQLYMVAAQ
jgi:hypothetical protein